MMDNTGGWINGSMGGSMWIWTVIGTLVVVLLVMAIIKHFEEMTQSPTLLQSASS